MDEIYAPEVYEERNNINVKSFIKFSALPMLAFFILSAIKGKVIYFIPYLILFYSILFLLPRIDFGDYKYLVDLSLIFLLYLLLGLIDVWALYLALFVLPAVFFIWVKEGEKEDIVWFTLWTLGAYMLFFSVMYITVISYANWVFPYFPQHPPITYVLLLFPVFYLLFLGFFYLLISLFSPRVEGEHKIYKLEYSILYSTIYTIIISVIFYLTLV